MEVSISLGRLCLLLSSIFSEKFRLIILLLQIISGVIVLLLILLLSVCHSIFSYFILPSNSGSKVEIECGVGLVGEVLLHLCQSHVLSILSLIDSRMEMCFYQGYFL